MSEITDYCPAITAIHKERVRNYLRNNQEIENLHQLRVQSRRILAHIQKESNLYRQLKETMKKSNPVRDIDVLMADTMPAFPKSLRKKIKSSGLIEKIKKTKSQKEKILREFLFDVEYAYEDFLFFQHPQNDEPAEATSKAPAKTAKKKSVPTVPVTTLNTDIQLLELPEKEVHKFRIQVKKERYTAEHQNKPNKKAISVFKKMQEYLGKFNDYCVFKETLHHYKIDSAIMKEVDGFLEDEKHELLEGCQQEIFQLKALSE